MKNLICVNCKKAPHEIEDYIDAAKDIGLPPDLYVQFNEGTYNFDKNIFACTQCYVLLGMPLGTAGNFKRGSLDESFTKLV
jgi:hypothetical protein